MVVGEAKGANQSEGLILGGGEAVADDDGASNDDAGIEDVGSGPGGGGARRLRELNWPHRFHSLIHSILQRIAHGKRKLEASSGEGKGKGGHGSGSSRIFAFESQLNSFTFTSLLVSRKWQAKPNSLFV